MIISYIASYFQMLKEVSLHPVEDFQDMVHHTPYQGQPTEYTQQKDIHACMDNTVYSCKYAVESHSSHVNMNSSHIKAHKATHTYTLKNLCISQWLGDNAFQRYVV